MTSTRRRRWKVSVRGLILIVAMIGLGFRIGLHFLPLTPAEAGRVAMKEMARRDPAFVRRAVIHEISPDEVNAGRLWKWAYRWDVILKDDDSPGTGFLVRIIDRDDIHVYKATSIRPDGCTWTATE